MTVFSEPLSKIQKNVKSFQKTVKNSTKSYYEQTRQKTQKSKKIHKKVLLNKVNKIRKWMIKTFKNGVWTVSLTKGRGKCWNLGIDYCFVAQPLSWYEIVILTCTWSRLMENRRSCIKEK